MASTGRRHIWAYVAALAAISVVSRLPQLLSPNLLVDGDECTLGLMARHLAHGREFPIFFYGQQYGLSSVEAAAGALAFVMFGSGAVQLKVAMLALWTLGVLFLFLALSRLVGARRGFWIAAVLLLSPMWAVWSMKARGGYLTSFTATAALLWLLVEDRERPSVIRWLVASALTFVIYLAQPLWLPGVLPVVVVAIVSRRRLLGGAIYLSVTAAGIFLVKTSVEHLLRNSDLIGSLPDVARQIYVSQTGAYYLWWALDPPGPATYILAFVWCGVLLAAALQQLYRLIRKQYCLWSHVLFVSVCSTLLAEWVLLRERDARYLLPLGALLVLLAGIELVDLIDRQRLPKRMVSALTLAVLLLGAVSMGEFREFSYLWKNPPGGLSEAKRMRQVLSYLKVMGVTHVFSMNGLLEWQLMFYSGEEVVARYTPWSDRYRAYVHEVDRALANGERVAVVGYTDTSGAPGCQPAIPVCSGDILNIAPHPDHVYTVDDKYFVYADASQELVDKLGFRFQPAER